MRVTVFLTSSLLVLALGVSACAAKAIDIGHDNPDGGGGGGGEAGTSSTTVAPSTISCPYLWSISPASPLDVCCRSTNGTCAVIARGDRPYTCSTTPDGCGCAFGGGGHRYELRCNEAVGCSCLLDGMPLLLSQPISPITGPKPLPYTCDGTAATMDGVWRDSCHFPDPTNVGAAGPCPYGFTQNGTSCCRTPDCLPAVADVPFSCAGAGSKGCGCNEDHAPHRYAMKCDANTCVCAVNGYVWTSPPANGVCDGGDAAMTAMWNTSCAFPPH